jgi:hypothetical protein
LLGADNALIDIRFAVNTNMGNDTVFLDNVAVSGTAIPSTPTTTPGAQAISEPTAVPLLGLGLFVLAASRRRSRRTAS